MTDLLSRTASSQGTSPRPSLPASAMWGALAAAAIGVGICMAVAVVGWFLADAGAHGSTTDALRVGADAWLLGHGSHAVIAGTPFGIVPLGLVAMLVLIGFRCGRWAARRAGRDAALRGKRPDRLLAQAVGLAIACYLTAAFGVAILTTGDNAQHSYLSMMLGAMAVGLAGLGSGLARETGRWQVWIGRAPRFVRTTLEGALVAALLVVAAGAIAVVAGLVWSFNDALMLMSSMRLGVGDAVMLTVLTALLAPNAALFGGAWLLGPGFAVGTGTTVSPSAVLLGALPNLPLLAALPSADAAVPAALAIVMVVPPLLAAVAAGRAQHIYGVRAWDSAALRGFGVGFGGAVVVWLAMLFAGGAMGTGRMSEVGPPLAEVLVASMGGMGIGGLVGGLAVTGGQRLRDRRTERQGIR